MLQYWHFEFHCLSILFILPNKNINLDVENSVAVLESIDVVSDHSVLESIDVVSDDAMAVRIVWSRTEI